MLQAVIDNGADVNATNKKNVTALMIASRRGNTDAVNELMNAGADPTIKDRLGATWIHHAVGEGCSQKLLQAIIDHGADVNATNKKNVTTLMTACRVRNTGTINILINAGADPNCADVYGRTWIHHAILANSKELLQAVIDYGADVNATNKKNVTALMIASRRGNIDAVNELLNAGADPTIKDGLGATWIHHAVGEGCSKEFLQAIIDHGADVNAANKKNITALMLACKKGNEGSINILLNAGADPNIADNDGYTCLHYAADRDCSKEAFQAIITHGPDVNERNKNNTAALMTACKKGNTATINIIMNAGADPNIADNDGYTCLHYAADGDFSEKALQAMIGHGADVNATNKENVTALMTACSNGNAGAINILLNVGADPNIADIDGNTCLHYTADEDCSRVALQAIIAHGADVNTTNKENVTPLMTACNNGNAGAINILMNAGADPNIADNDGYTCLHYVALDGRKEALQAIIAHGAGVNAANKENVTALMTACGKGNTGAINILMTVGANPDIADNDGYTCLHYAADGDCSKEALQAIIGYGVDVNARNKENATALMIACSKGNTSAINILLNAGADANSADVYGRTLIHYAISTNSKELLQVVIDHSADMNATNKNNTIALILACQEGNVDTLNALLNAGADPNIADNDGYTCLHYATDGDGSNEALQAIIYHGGDVNATNKENVTALMTACSKGNTGAINILMDAGADLNIADIDGYTCLHYVAVYCRKEALQTIIGHGANVNARNNKNVTALMTACSKGNTGAINILMNAGADPNIADNDGYTCLHYAARGDGSTEVVEAIITHGADLNARNIFNVTAIMLACEKGNLDVAKFLLNSGADFNIGDVISGTYLHYAVLVGCGKEMLQMMIDHGIDFKATVVTSETALVLASEMKSVDAINTDMNVYTNPDLADVYGATSIHCAILGSCSTEVLKVILDNGADVNAANEKNKTALILASQKGNEDAINVLVTAKADPNISDIYGNTCLHYAVDGDCSKEMIQTLIDHGVDVNMANTDNMTELMLACQEGNIDAIDALLTARATPDITSINGDAIVHHTDNRCFSSCSLQTMIQWLNLTFDHIYLPAFQLTESLCFNAASHIICYKLWHALRREM